MAVIIRTPSALERRYRLLASIHSFRWGLHVKLRRGDRWRHFVAKLSRGSTLGQKQARKMLWVAWWQSRKGVRGRLNGWRFWAAVDRLPAYPPDTTKIPFFPQQRPGRGRDAA